MTFFQSLWRDLVDKRLWPVAIVLLIAAAAVPFLIGSGASETASAPAAPASTEAGGPAVAGAGQITVAVTDTTKERSRPGPARDPFRPEVFATVAKVAGAAAVPSTASGSTAAKPTPSSGGAVGGSGSAGAGTTTPGATTPAGGSTGGGSVTTTETILDYELGVRIGRTGALKSMRGLKAVSYLPSAAYPLVSFLGTKKRSETAVFLVADRVIVSGADRVCRPSRKDCRLLELEAGDTVLLGRKPAAGGPVKHWRLHITSIRLEEQPDIAKAAPTAKASRSTRAAGLPGTELAPPSRRVRSAG